MILIANWYKDITLPQIAETLFLLGIFVLPFQIYTIIAQPDIHLSGQSSEFTNAAIYATDILIILSAILFFPGKKKPEIGNKLIFTLLLALCSLLLILNTVFPITWLIFRLATFALIYLLIINGITKQESLFKTLLAAGALQAIIAIMQFVGQGSIGLGFLGEPNLDASGIAKIDIGDEKIIRGYGTMAHPNILGGFLVIAIILGASIKKWIPITAICLAGLVFTFSRSAMVALLAVTILYALFNIRKILKSNRAAKGQPPINNCFALAKHHFKQKYLALVLIIALLAAGTAFKSHIFSLYEIEERLTQLNPTIDMITESPLGVGWQNFTNEIQNYTDEKLMPWEYQPIHNIYLLITSELGIVGTILFLFLIFHTFLESKPKLKYALLALIIIGLADHYLYTLYQGEILAITTLAAASHYK